MRLSIYGLGYVGAVTAACFAKEGRTVIGVDPNPVKVDLINRGETPIVEEGVRDLIAAGLAEGRISATTSAEEGVLSSDLSLICVGTPSRRNGSLDTSHVETVCREIGAALKKKSTRHTIVIRSTILPGTMRNVVIPALEEASGMKAGEGFGVANNPEFLRESTAVKDFYDPPKTVIGAIDRDAADAVASLYAMLDAPLIVTSLETAEMVKYVDNCWHGLKVAFGNEIGNLCKALGIDSHEVMDIFCQDTKLNLSPYYLKPGFAFGGSCLPKDLRALNFKARELDVDAPVLASVLPSNRNQIERAVDWVAATGKKKIAFLGFSFKAGTDDLRESPQVEVIERLIGKGFDLKLYDRNVQLARLTGANRDYILKVIPHIADLMVDSVDEAIAHGEIVIIGNPEKEFASVPKRLGENQRLLDFVRLKDRGDLGHRYDGINW